MKVVKIGNWWLKLLALVLAIVIYHVIKGGTVRTETHHDRTLFQQH